VTTVVEIDGLEHRHAVMSPVIIGVMDNLMQELIQHSLCFKLVNRTLPAVVC